MSAPLSTWMTPTTFVLYVFSHIVSKSSNLPFCTLHNILIYLYIYIKHLQKQLNTFVQRWSGDLRAWLQLVAPNQHGSSAPFAGVEPGQWKSGRKLKAGWKCVKILKRLDLFWVNFRKMSPEIVFFSSWRYRAMNPFQMKQSIKWFRDIKTDTPQNCHWTWKSSFLELNGLGLTFRSQEIAYFISFQLPNLSDLAPPFSSTFFPRIPKLQGS